MTNSPEVRESNLGKPCYICKREWGHEVPEDSICSKCHPSAPKYEREMEDYCLAKQQEAVRDACWEWKGKIDKRTGYGKASYLGKHTTAHRCVYLLTYGDDSIPEGYHIDHLCRNRSCVNPDHLEAVTPGENVLRGEGVTAVNSKKTHCKNGHEFTADNTYSINGWRHCRVCKVRFDHEHKARKRALAQLSTPEEEV